MEKIKNGDAVLYKNQRGTIYGKPRQSKFGGVLYTVKIGDEYYKASPAELTPEGEEPAQPASLLEPPLKA